MSVPQPHATHSQGAEAHPEQQLIGVFGSGRNGSSLLVRLLDGADETYTHPLDEGFVAFFDDVRRKGKVSKSTCFFAGGTRPVKLDRQLPGDLLIRPYHRNLHRLCEDYIARYTGRTVSPSRVIAHFAANRFDAAGFIRAYFAATAALAAPGRMPGKVVFKSIETPHIGDYAALFPDMRFLHILRDPVQVCSSAKRTLMERKQLPAAYLGGDWLVTMIEKRWIPHAQHILHYRCDPRHHLVRYEDLVARPAAVLRAVRAWACLASDPRTSMTQTCLNGIPLHSSEINSSKAGVPLVAQPTPAMREMFDYDEVLSAREIDYIKYRTRQLRGQFGYTSDDEPGWRKTALPFLHVDEWEFAHCTTAKWWLKGLRASAVRRSYLLRRHPTMRP